MVAFGSRLLGLLLGAALVYFMFPKHDAEKQLLEQYEREDQAAYAKEHPAL